MKIFVVIIALAAVQAQKGRKGISKTKSGGRGGFYSSRFGSVYNAQDFTEQPTTVLPALLREIQIPSEVARPHEQNLDEGLRSDVPNVEDHTIRGLMPGSLVIGPTTFSSVTNLPLVRTKSTKTKGIKGGRKGYRYDVNVRALFSDPESTTLGSYNPKILNVPTQPNMESITENYQQEIIQQTELPVQQTELPVQQTQIPIRETEPTTPRYIQTTEFEPIQETQSPIEPQITQRPQYPTTTEYPINDQQTEIPQMVQLPESVQSTQTPTTMQDEFSRYPLGVQGRHLIKGTGAGKGKKGSKHVSKGKTILIGHRATADPSQPLLPSLMG